MQLDLLLMCLVVILYSRIVFKDNYTTTTLTSLMFIFYTQVTNIPLQEIVPIVFVVGFVLFWFSVYVNSLSLQAQAHNPRCTEAIIVLFGVLESSVYSSCFNVIMQTYR